MTERRVHQVTFPEDDEVRIRRRNREVLAGACWFLIVIALICIAMPIWLASHS